MSEGDSVEAGQKAYLANSAVIHFGLPPTVAKLFTITQLRDLHYRDRLRLPTPRAYPLGARAYFELVNWIADRSPVNRDLLLLSHPRVIRDYAKRVLDMELDKLRIDQVPNLASADAADGPAGPDGSDRRFPGAAPNSFTNVIAAARAAAFSPMNRYRNRNLYSPIGVQPSTPAVVRPEQFSQVVQVEPRQLPSPAEQDAGQMPIIGIEHAQRPPDWDARARPSPRSDRRARMRGSSAARVSTAAAAAMTREYLRNSQPVSPWQRSPAVSSRNVSPRRYAGRARSPNENGNNLYNNGGSNNYNYSNNPAAYSAGWRTPDWYPADAWTPASSPVAPDAYVGSSPVDARGQWAHAGWWPGDYRYRKWGGYAAGLASPYARAAHQSYYREPFANSNRARYGL